MCWSVVQEITASPRQRHHAREARGVAHLRYIAGMKTASLPSIRVEPELRAEVEALLGKGETLSEFFEASVRNTLRQRREQAEFVARGIRSIENAMRSGDYVDADVVIAKLERKLAAARKLKAAKR